MKNFTEMHRDGGGYEYHSVETGNGAVISTYYYKDGNPRGIVMTCNRMELRQETGHGTTYTVKTVELGSGVYLHVLPLQRSSPKSLVAFAAFMDEELPAVAETFLVSGRDEARHELTRLIEYWRALHTQETAKVLEGIRR